MFIVSGNKILVGTAAALCVSLIWGLSFVAARIVLVTLSPLLLATLRFSVASMIFIPVLINEAIKGFRPRKRDLTEFLLLGLMSITVYFWLQYTGVKYAGAGVSAVLVVGMIPIMTGLMSQLVLREKLTAMKTLGIILGLSGVALIALPNLILGQIDLFFYLGVASLLMDAALFSVYSTLSKRLMTHIGRPLAVTAYTTILGTLGLIPLSLTSDWSQALTLQTGQAISILYLALVCSCLGYFLWNFALSKLETVKAAVWLYMEPVAAFVGEALILNVMPAPLTLAGGGAVIAGALITSRSTK